MCEEVWGEVVVYMCVEGRELDEWIEMKVVVGQVRRRWFCVG